MNMSEHISGKWAAALNANKKFFLSNVEDGIIMSSWVLGSLIAEQFNQMVLSHFMRLCSL